MGMGTSRKIVPIPIQILEVAQKIGFGTGLAYPENMDIALIQAGTIPYQEAFGTIAPIARIIAYGTHYRVSMLKPYLSISVFSDHRPKSVPPN
jgi:hypothetical protein